MNLERFYRSVQTVSAALPASAVTEERDRQTETPDSERDRDRQTD